MSNSFRLYCPKTKEAVWIGQGGVEIKTIYADEPDTIEKLRQFLNKNIGEQFTIIHDYSEVEFEDFNVT